MNNIKTHTLILWACLAACMTAYLLFSQTVMGGDNEAHLKFAIGAVETGKYPPHFLYHFLLNVLSGFTTDRNILEPISAVILSAAVAFKIYFSLLLYQAFVKKTGKTVSVQELLITACCLLFAGPMINWWQFPIIYKGQFTPNIWHNPTSVLLMPFASAIVYLIFKEDGPVSLKNAFICAALLCASVLIKPNLGLVMIPGALTLILIKKLTLRNFAMFIIPACLLLAWQFMQNYTAAGTMTIEHHKSSIIFSPLTVWKSWTGSFAGSAVVSFGFITVYLYLFWGKQKESKFMVFALTLLVIALAYFLLFAETGDKLRHGNFFWGTVPALYFVFLSCIYELFRLSPSTSDPGERLAIYSCYTLLALHLAGGIMFYVRTLMGNSFYA